MNIIMPGGGDSGPDGEEEESELSLEMAGAPGGARERRRRQTMSSEQRERGGEEKEERRRRSGRRKGGEESGASGGEAGQDNDEEMMTSSGSHHDLSSSSSANHSPRSTTRSVSTSTSKSEHADSSRGHTHREMMTTMTEMKKRLPSDKRSGRSKARTVDALQYALNCVKQVQANSEYYKLLMCKGQEERLDATVCTLVELERVTSEHTLKNTDSFLVVFSLASGRVLYASEQAPSILCCKRKFLESAKFVELLFHQDVNVFYSHTAQPHLPPWSSSPTAAVLFECAQVKSFFCRIRGGKDSEGEMRYNPFRITPYLLKVQETGTSGTEESCCLALAERIISGYEAPRIPVDKRIFTTTHSPGCVFLEVDDRAVPLLGYLPQDLIGTSLLTCVHPEDRPLMLSVHKKVLKYAGLSPFEHSPVRLRCQNGDYVTLDTSWSSFINPWSRKVAFIIGRHKVRTSPLNEDVFAARIKDDLPTTYEEVKTLQAKIYKLFLQPIHNNGSSGYGSLGSNGSHEHYTGVASSSDSNGNLWDDSHREPMTLRQICADVNRVKSWGQQAYLDSRNKLIPLGKPATAAPPPTACNANVRGHHKEGRKQAHIPSYQQINCVDNIIKFLESCTTPDLKRKNECRSQATSSSSSSEDDKPTGVTHTAQAASDEVVLDSQVSVDTSTVAAVVGAPLTDITMSTITAMSVVSVTSQCSYSSTIVHVPQPESEVMALEDAPMGSEPADPPAPAAAPSPPKTPPARPAAQPHSPAHSSSSAMEEELQLLGLLTKEVLSAHTQKEEQEYVDLYRHRILQSPYSSYLQQDSSSMAHSHHPGDTGWNRTRTGKAKHKRAKPLLQGSSDSYASPPDNPLMLQRSGSRPPPHSSWLSSESSSHPQVGGVGGVPVPYNNQIQMPPGVLLQQQTPYPVPMMTTTTTTPHQQQITGMPPMVLQPPDQSQTGFGFNVMQPVPSDMQWVHLQSFQMQNIQNFPSMVPPLVALPGINPYDAAAAAAAPPVMAVILPSYPTASFTPCYPHHHPSIFPPTAVSSMMMPQPQVPFTTMAGFAPGNAPDPFLQAQAQLQALPGPPPPPQHQAPHQTSSLVVVGPLFGMEEEEEEEEEEEAGPPALFSSSRSSSPLQLNLLQEELPGQRRPSEEGASSTGQHNHHLLADSGTQGDDAPSESGNHDAQSTTSELLDLMLQEDARSGTGSNASGSGSGESRRSMGSSGSGSGSNGTSTSHTGSSNSSKYFASNDSSDTSRKARKSQQQEEGTVAEHQHQHDFEPRVENSLWSMIQQTPESVMMTYQIHTRDQEEVLAEDREKLRVLEPLQPWFSQSQRRELAQVHPWIRQHAIPPTIGTQGCVGCSADTGMMTMSHSSPLSPPPPPAPDSSSPMESTPEREDPPQDPCPLQDT